jgi:hypothetical protein
LPLLQERRIFGFKRLELAELGRAIKKRRGRVARAQTILDAYA